MHRVTYTLKPIKKISLRSNNKKINNHPMLKMPVINMMPAFYFNRFFELKRKNNFHAYVSANIINTRSAVR